MELRILGAHQWESTTYKCACALVDGVIGIDAGSICSTLSPAEQTSLRALLLTHHHLDHIKDFGSIAFQTAEDRTLDVYTTPVVRRIVTDHITNSGIWLDLESFPSSEAPAVRYHEVEARRCEQFEGYTIRPVPVPHSIPCMGFEISGADGKRLFYTSDTGPKWTEEWNRQSPKLDLIVTETTFANQDVELARLVFHQTPELVRTALGEFRDRCGYLPPVVVTHVQPPHDALVREQLADVAKALRCEITVATEGQRFEI